MRILRAIVESTPNLMAIAVVDLSHRRSIEAKPVSEALRRLDSGGSSESPCRANWCCAPAGYVRRIHPHKSSPEDRQGIATRPRRGSLWAMAPA
jgi:hypothetical protein